MKHFKFLFLLPVLALAVMAQTCVDQATYACRTMNVFKVSFDQLAAQGEFSRATVTNVNAVYIGAKPLCDNPGNYKLEDVVAIATNAYIVIKRAMDESGNARTVLYPQFKDLERFVTKHKEK